MLFYYSTVTINQRDITRVSWCCFVSVLCLVCAVGGVGLLVLTALYIARVSESNLNTRVETNTQTFGVLSTHHGFS